MDSDGDGRTNGQELGDPNCLWKEGTIPDFVTGITHPGNLVNVVMLKKSPYRMITEYFQFQIGINIFIISHIFQENVRHSLFLKSGFINIISYRYFDTKNQFVDFFKVPRVKHAMIIYVLSVNEKCLFFIYIGVCEPMNSTICLGKNTWVDCSSESFQCEALKKDPGM